jgi:hypothetical protein
VEDLRSQNLRAAQSIAPGGIQRVTFKAPGRGWYYVEVKVTRPATGRTRSRSRRRRLRG